MAVSAHVYGNALLNLSKKVINLSTDALWIELLTSTYTPAQATHQYESDLTLASNEVVGTGYTAGGQQLTSVTVAQSSDVLTLSAANPSWASSTITARYAVVVDKTPGTAATNPLICYIDFGANVSSTAAAFTITWSGSGIMTITAS
jgi:hypothetical protein